MTRQTCGRCRHWKPSTDGIRAGISGECRREAPRLGYGKAAGSRGQFPTMPREEWCGRFDYKDGEEPFVV
jgi:hypothetical protein